MVISHHPQIVTLEVTTFLALLRIKWLSSLDDQIICTSMNLCQMIRFKLFLR